MAQLEEQVNKYKNLFINAVIIIAALIVAYNLYNSGSSNAESLRAKISGEEKKNMELEKIGKLEKKITAYRKLLVERDDSAVMNDISDIAKDAGVEVVSVRPSQKEPGSDYTKSLFELTINANGYDKLAKFINAVESYNNVYMIESMDINSQPGPGKSELTISLRVSSVSANQ